MHEFYKALYETFVEGLFKETEKRNKTDSNLWNLVPTALCLNEDQPHMYLLPWKTDDEKVSMLRALGKKCYEHKITKIGIIVDIAMKSYNKIPEDDTQLPLTYPPEMRIEAFFLTYMDLKEPSENDFRLFPYKLINGKVVRSEETFFKENTISMQSIFSNEILLGFLSSAMMDELQKREIMHVELNKELGDSLLDAVLKDYPGAAQNFTSLSSEDSHENT